MRTAAPRVSPYQREKKKLNVKNGKFCMYWYGLFRFVRRWNSGPFARLSSSTRPKFFAAHVVQGPRELVVRIARFLLLLHHPSRRGLVGRRTSPIHQRHGPLDRIRIWIRSTPLRRICHRNGSSASPWEIPCSPDPTGPPAPAIGALSTDLNPPPHPITFKQIIPRATLFLNVINQNVLIVVFLLLFNWVQLASQNWSQISDS